MRATKNSFFSFIIDKKRHYLVTALCLGVVYFFVLRLLFPIASYYSDSFTWVGAAQSGQPVTMRPIGYSKLIMFFKIFSTSEVALIFGQYFFNLAANLVLFFTVTYLFHIQRYYRVALFFLLIVNPLYLFYSNYLSSDAFFNSLTVVWFTCLIWLMHKRSAWVLTAAFFAMAALFELRYNALFFPGIFTGAILLSQYSTRGKIIYSALTFFTIMVLVLKTTAITEKFTGTRVFSAFSGWQMANNALHIVRHENISPAEIKDPEARQLLVFTSAYLKNNHLVFADSVATAFYMWDINSPLKKYMNIYPGKKKSYFATWNALGPVYSTFGKEVISRRPFSYVRRFVYPNARAYFNPSLEIYKTYMEDRDTIPAVVQKYYGYTSNVVPPNRPFVYRYVFEPFRSIFLIINVLLPFLISAYLLKKRKFDDLLSKTVLCFSLFYVTNFTFIVFLAPTVIRYHLFIGTLGFPIVLLLVQSLTGTDKKRVIKPFPDK